MKSSLNFCKHLLYADDTVFYLTGDLQRSTADLQTDVCDFSPGLKSQTQKIKNHSLFINDVKLEKVAS